MKNRFNFETSFRNPQGLGEGGHIERRRLPRLFLVVLNLRNSTNQIKNNAEVDAALGLSQPDISKSVGIRAACLFGWVSQDLRQQTSSKRYPAFFLYVAKRVEMLHSGFGYLTEKRERMIMKFLNAKFIPILSMVLVVISVSCSPTPDSYLKRFTRFVEDVEQNASDYTDEMWDQKDAEFKLFTNEEYDAVAHEITPDDKEVIGELVVRYYKAKGVAMGQSWVDLIDGWCKTVKGGIKGLFGNDFLKDHGIDVDSFNLNELLKFFGGEERSDE